MKLNKERFIQSCKYIAEINMMDLKDIDLSEITKNDLIDMYNEFTFTGLSNKDIILTLIESNN